MDVSMGWKSRVIVLCMLLAPLPLSGQSDTAPARDTAKTPRKIIHMAEAPYPWDLRRASIGGVVKLEVLVSSKGTVEQVSILGGNPILADAATSAVKKWKYAPADSATMEHVNVLFDPHH
jgi:TonB family protein